LAVVTKVVSAPMMFAFVAWVVGEHGHGPRGEAALAQHGGHVVRVVDAAVEPTGHGEVGELVDSDAECAFGHGETFLLVWWVDEN
jgi:hypothetical protein